MRQKADIHAIELEISAILSSSSDILTSGLRAKHSEDVSVCSSIDDRVTMNGRDLMNILSILVNRFRDDDGLIAQLRQVNERLSTGLPCSTRRFELEALQVGKVNITQLCARLLRPPTNVCSAELYRSCQVLR